MSDAEVFDEAMTREGGAYRRGLLPAQTAARVESHFAWLSSHAHVTNAETSCTLSPCFGLVASREFNAVAFRHRGLPCVGVNVGAMQALDGLFCRLMSDRRVLVQIGRPADEIELDTLPAPYLSVLTDPAVVQPMPRCPERRWWADASTKQALRFLLRHELAHLANGHVDLLAAGYGEQFLTELGWTGENPAELLDRQTMEFDADSCAASWWCGIFLEQWFHKAGYDDTKAIPDAEVETKVAPELWIGFFQWAFAVSALFRLFGDAGFAGRDLTVANYPPMRLRQVIVLRTVTDHVRLRWNRRLADLMVPAIRDGLDVAEESIELVTGSARLVEGLRDAVNDPGNLHINRLIEHWKTSLRPRLLPYALGGYLPD